MATTQSFEQSLERLLRIVESLENEAVGLADAMKLYEEGTEIVQSCRKALESAELRITELRTRIDGGYDEVEFAA
jgi:exodeoxyribonuclease VII small subunit